MRNAKQCLKEVQTTNSLGGEQLWEEQYRLIQKYGLREN